MRRPVPVLACCLVLAACTGAGAPSAGPATTPSRDLTRFVPGQQAVRPVPGGGQLTLDVFGPQLFQVDPGVAVALDQQLHVVFTVTVTNSGTVALPIGPSNFVVTADHFAPSSPIAAIPAGVTASPLAASTLAPGDSVSGTVAADDPVGIGHLELVVAGQTLATYDYTAELH